ncbi:MAG: hypothetical protein U9P63_00080 [Patescibacteria group bacterium]|nr:hypothetical protein [Patescibacteria group bacterium]
MISFKEKLFKKAVVGIIIDGEYNADLPRSSFIKTIIRFRKIGGTVFLRNSSAGVDYSKWENLFLEILDELGMEVKLGILGKSKTVVTPEMRRGAYGAQIRHSEVLKYDT